MSARREDARRPGPTGWAAAFAAALAFAGPARANDSTAELATGGLVFVKNPAVAMRAEDLYVSAGEIRVHYTFRNGSSADLTALVAFPMPDIRIASEGDNFAVPTEDPRNILGFSTAADGRPVATRVEQKALAGGRDHSALLAELGVPLAPHLAGTQAALDRVPRNRWPELVRLGLAEIVEYDDTGTGLKQHLAPRWTLKTTYFWDQRFPAGRDLVIEHHYKPSLGQSVHTALGEPDAPGLAEYRRKYCLDRDFLDAVAKARRNSDSTYGGPYAEERIAYVLATGANWAGPIGEFRLVVDKGAPENLVSFCATGVRKIGPTQFEWRRTEFTPGADLAILILKRLPRGN